MNFILTKDTSAFDPIKVSEIKLKKGTIFKTMRPMGGEIALVMKDGKVFMIDKKDKKNVRRK